MENEFKQVLTLLENINTSKTKKTVLSSELKKEFQRIEDLNWLNQDTAKHLFALEKTAPAAIDDIMGEICHFNVNLHTYAWHIESIQNIIEKFIVGNAKND